MARKIGKCILRIVEFSLVVLLAVNLSSVFVINLCMFHPHPVKYPMNWPGMVSIADAGGNVAAVWLPAEKKGVKTILYSHGNGEDIGDRYELFQKMQKSGFSVFSYDYPGYGHSPGKPSEREVYRAAEAAYGYLTGKLGVKPADIVIFGYSIGSGPACYLAEKYAVAGLVFQSGFMSAPRAVSRIRLLWLDPFPNARRIKKIACPKLFIHGQRDITVPFSQGRRVYELAEGRKECVWIPLADHNDIPGSLPPGRYLSILHRFVDSL